MRKIIYLLPLILFACHNNSRFNVTYNECNISLCDTANGCNEFVGHNLQLSPFYYSTHNGKITANFQLLIEDGKEVCPSLVENGDTVTVDLKVKDKFHLFSTNLSSCIYEAMVNFSYPADSNKVFLVRVSEQSL
jgi:hypothetical protein